MKKLDMKVSDMDLIEANEAFAAQSLAVGHDLGFEMDKLNFDWRQSKGNFEFIPGNIEISVKQRPDVIIKYIGGPIYVPPSSDPDYEPVDVHA